MRNYHIFLTTAVSPTLALLVLISWTSGSGGSLHGPAASDFASKASYSGNLTLPNPASVWVAQPASRLSETDKTMRDRVVETYGQLPLSFEANQGQTDP